MIWIKRFLKNEEGATAVEYALMAAAIAGVIAVAAFLLGSETGKLFQDTTTKLQDAKSD